MEKLINQDWRNPFKNCVIGEAPYQLIFAGEGVKNVELPDGTVTHCSDTKRDLEVPQLFAWNLEGKALLEWVEYLNEHPECPCKLVVDSGAYSMWSRGKEFDMDEYINFLNSNKVIETCFWAAEADVIPGRMNVDPTEEERAAAPEKSWNNFLYMIDRVKVPKKIVPIYHQGEDIKHLKRMLSYRYHDGDFIPYIGISPRNDVHVGEKVKWYEEIWKVIYEDCAALGRDIPLTHNFGMTTISLMEQYPSYTSDSTSWIRSASFGNILLIINGMTKSVYVSDRNPDASDHINNQSTAVKEAVDKMCREIGHGITLKHLVEDDENGRLRMLFNIYSLNKWRMNYKPKYNMQFKVDLF